MSARDDQWRYISALAGRDEFGGLLPPTAEDLAAGIDRRPCPWWSNRALRATGAQNPESADQRPTDTRRPKPIDADG